MNVAHRQFLAGLAAAFVAVALPAAAQTDPGHPGRADGTVTLSATGAAIGVGYTWGDGTLFFKGRRYRFSVRGVSVADVGYSHVTGHGRVYNLHKLSDFSGTYGASTGEATLVNGLAGQFLQNGNGVQIRIDDVTRGARLSGSADGIQLQLR